MDEVNIEVVITCNKCGAKRKSKPKRQITDLANICQLIEIEVPTINHNIHYPKCMDKTGRCNKGWNDCD